MNSGSRPAGGRVSFLHWREDHWEYSGPVSGIEALIETFFGEGSLPTNAPAFEKATRLAAAGDRRFLEAYLYHPDYDLSKADRRAIAAMLRGECDIDLRAKNRLRRPAPTRAQKAAAEVHHELRMLKEQGQVPHGSTEAKKGDLFEKWAGIYGVRSDTVENEFKRLPRHLKEIPGA